MKKSAVFFSLLIILGSCSDQVDESLVVVNKPWKSNNCLQWDSDSMVSIFYGDTVINFGPLKYVSFQYNTGDHFYGEQVFPKTNETHSEFIHRLTKARNEYHDKCTECGDLNYWQGTKQNLEIITLYSLIANREFDSASAFLDKKRKNWYNSSRYSDLYLALLLETYGREQIEKELNAIQLIDKKDSIKIGSEWIHWQPINEYDFKRFQNEIRWKDYFEITLNRMETKGI